MLKQLTRKLIFCAFIPPLLFSAGCTNSSISEEKASSASLAITPFLTTTTTPETEEKNETPQADELPAASPTPLAYVVVANDTLLGIAQRYAVSLDALLAANPGVNPNFLTLGMEILVPQGQDGEAAIFGAPTALPLDLRESNCYATAAGELWCFLLVENQQTEAVENLAASITLFSSSGEMLDSVEAIAPLNLLRSGASAPLVAYWATAPQDWETASGQLLTAYRVSDFESRYISADLSNVAVDIARDGLSARVNAGLDLESASEASLVWVLAVAYDAENSVLGLRRWEGRESDVEIELWIYSLGGAIDRVDLQVEARP